MPPEELFKLLQVAILVENPGEVPLAVRFPTRKELLDGVPLPEKDFALLLRFQRRGRFHPASLRSGPKGCQGATKGYKSLGQIPRCSASPQGTPRQVATSD